MLALLFLTVGFFWNEARKEVKYLCGNFQPGVTKESVVRQLNTGTILRYQSVSNESGVMRLSVSSPMAPFTKDCIVYISPDRTVASASYL